MRDFDSNNSSRDAHSLEVLNELKYPEIKLTVDLDDNAQILKSKYVKFRDDIFDLLTNSDITKGSINYDSAFSQYVISKMKQEMILSANYENSESEGAHALEPRPRRCSVQRGGTRGSCPAGFCAPGLVHDEHAGSVQRRAGTRIEGRRGENAHVA